jgi:hypothetical protein
MDAHRIKSALANIERNERALEWLEKYGTQLSIDSGLRFEPVLSFAGSCTGADEASEMIAGYARKLVPELVQTSIQNCRNTIELDMAAIREEVGLPSPILSQQEKAA